MFNRRVTDLPAEILLQIFSYLDLTDILNIFVVNTFLSQLLNDNQFWKKKYEQSFPHLGTTFSNEENIRWKDKLKSLIELELEYKELPEIVKNMFIAIRTSSLFLLIQHYKEHNDEYLNYKHTPEPKKPFRDMPANDTPLECANRIGNAEVFSYLFALKMENIARYTFLPEEYGRQMVFTSIHFHSPLRSIKNLITQEMIKKRRDQHGNTLLILAAKHKSAETGIYLIEKGANINARNAYNQTALMKATQYGNNDLIKLLLQKKAILTSDLLQIAAQHQQLIAAQLLLEHGISPQKFNSKGENPLIIAVKNQDLQMVEILLKYKADVNYIDDKDRSVLYFAAVLKNEALIQVLLKYNVNTDIVCTSLMLGYIKSQDKLIHVCIRRRMFSVIRTLVEQGMDINLLNRKNETPLHVAILEGDIAIADYLLKKGANVNTQDAKGRTAVFLAVQTNQNKMVELLLKYNADVNIAAKSSDDNYICIQKLVIYMKNKPGDAPLHVASRNGNVHLIQLLLKHGADVCTRNKHHQTPADVGDRNAKHTVVLKKIEMNTPYRESALDNSQKKLSYFCTTFYATLFGRPQEKEEGTELKMLIYTPKAS